MAGTDGSCGGRAGKADEVAHARGGAGRSGRRHALTVGLGLTAGLVSPVRGAGAQQLVRLAPPAREAPHALHAAIAARRSVRRYATEPLQLEALAELLWAGQGVSGDQGLRTVPSAGALYPLELHLAARRVRGLAAGVYRYLSATHALEPIALEAAGGDAAGLRLATAAAGQVMLDAVPAVIAIVARHAVTAAKYGARAERYVAIEAGAAAQNIALQAAALALGTVVVGAFDDDALARLLRLGAGLRPLILMPVGVPA